MEPDDIKKRHLVRETDETTEVLEQVGRAKDSITQAALKYFRALRRERALIDERHALESEGQS